MRVIVFFDLPTLTASDKREYNAFRKFLIRDGFFMMQESVYCKLAVNQAAANAIVMQLKTNKQTGIGACAGIDYYRETVFTNRNDCW